MKLHVRTDIGKGDPLVLLHGMFAESSQWDEIALLLSGDFRVIAVDLLGHGKSPRPKGASYSAKQHAEALHKTLRSIKATVNATLVGYSMGGAVALAYSSLYPENVSQLYLISTPFYLKPEQMIPVQYAGSLLLTKANTGFFGLVEKIMKKQRFSRRLTEFGNKSATFHKIIGSHENELDAVIVRKNLQQLIRKFNFVGYLKRLNAPLTFYAGKKDLYIIQGQLDALRQYQPNMDIQRLDIIKIDHMLVQNLPNEIARLLRRNKNSLLNVAFDKGEGNPLVLLHGIEGSSSYWQSLMPVLKQKRRVIGIDLLGFGNSPKLLNIAYTMDQQVEWLDRTIKSLGLDSFELMCHSLGSLVALAYSAKHPRQVKSMTLMSPVFLPTTTTNNQLMKRIHFIDKISDGSYLYSQTARALGYERMSKYLPLIRTVKNGVQNQDWIQCAKAAANVRTRILIGSKDLYLDRSYLEQITSHLKNSELTVLKGVGHNFPFFNPSVTAQNLGIKSAKVDKLKSKGPIPKTFLRQMAKLASPVLLVKSLFYITLGLTLFTQYAPWIVTFGLAYVVFKLGYSYIRGAFSLKNENLSYFGYIFLGIAGIVLGYFLIRHPELSLRISFLIICGLIFLSGASRVLVALVWTNKKRLKRQMLGTGLLMSFVGALAIAGSIISLRVILLTIAIVCILRGLQFGIYACTAMALAYVRGYNT